MAPPNITSIPLELLLQITSYLSTTDYGAVRLTCKDLEASLFKTFAQQYFTTIPFLRIEFSLQALIDISKSRLSPYLKHVMIHPLHTPSHADEVSDWTYDPDLDFGSDYGPPRPNLRPEDLDRPEDLELYQRFHQFCLNQIVLTGTGHDQQMLVEALRNLSLETVSIVGSTPSASESRFARSYGHIGYGTYWVYRDWQKKDSSYSRETRIYDKVVTPNTSFLQSILSALGKSGVVFRQLKIVDMDQITDEALNIPAFMEKTILPMLSNLEALDLDLKVGGPSRLNQISSDRIVSWNGRIVSSNGRKPYRIYNYYLGKFLLHSNQIKRLYIRGSGLSDDLLAWLATPTTDEEYHGHPGLSPPMPPTFPNLYELQILKGSSCGYHEVNVIGIIKKFSTTLRRLHLSGLQIEMPNLGRWPQFVAQLTRIGNHLEEVQFSEMGLHLSRPEKSCYKNSLHMKFNQSKDHLESRHFFYNGPNMEKVLGDLVKTTTLCDRYD